MKNEPKRTVKFAVFADFHYKKNMRIESPDDLRAVMKRAHENGAEFVLNMGDLCNDCLRSPEIYETYLKNPYGLAVYGVCGNHEMQTDQQSVIEENSLMSAVAPRLTNRSVVWGGAGYYYTDLGGFRLVALDTNYSWNKLSEEWEHNPSGSHYAPEGNEKPDSLGTEQLGWLEAVLEDALLRELNCIVFSHASFSGVWRSSPDHQAVRALFKRVNGKRQGTVLMALNGHYHSDHQAVVEDVIYFDVNTCRDGLWDPNGEKHYGDLKYSYTDFDAEGKACAQYLRPIDELWFSKYVWYYSEPLSAIVTLSSDRSATIEGAETTWLGGVDPHTDYVAPKISSATYPRLEREENKFA